MELAVEDLSPVQRREGIGVGGHPHPQAHRSSRPRPDGHGPGRGSQERVARGGAELQREAVAAVEGAPLHPHQPSAFRPGRRNGRLEPPAHLVHAGRIQQGQMPPPLLRRQPRETRHQQRLLRHPERLRREGKEMPLGILEVALDPHGAEHEPAQLHPRDIEREPELEAPCATGPGDGGRVVAPGGAHRPAARVTRGEPHALVRGVGPDQHGAAALRLQIDLDRVALRVPVEAGLIALVGRWVVESRLREGEDRCHLRRLEQQRERERARRHRGPPSPRGTMRRPEASTTTS